MYLAKNNAYSTLAVGLASGGTTLQVQTGHGDRFPVVTGADHTFVTLEDAAGNIEIVKVTARAAAADVMTIVRAQEGTAARAWAIGDIVEGRLTAAVIEDATNKTAATTAFTPAGNIAATDVQAAIQELDSEKSDVAHAHAGVYQPLDATLTALAGLSTGANKLPYSTGADTFAETAFPAAGRSLIGDTGTKGLFIKADPTTVAFTKTGAGTASIKAGTKVDVAGTLVSFASATAITMPTLTAGTDYAIWVKDDATIQADASFSTPPGAGNWRKIGGFHYAPGGNAAAQAGGDTTPAINAYSLWDLKFLPACPDPRGMTLVADSFWADIYLLGVDHLTNGTSKYNVSIADSSAPPKIPTKFGGSGSSAYSTLTWWEAAEVMESWGKRLPTYAEFAALAYGTTEATASGGTDVPTTGVTGTGATNAWNKFTSRWGAIQVSGCLWQWGSDFGGPYSTAAWTANTGGRGSTYNLSDAVLLGGNWGLTTECGSRCSIWSNSPTYSYNNLGARGVCDHLILD